MRAIELAIQADPVLSTSELCRRVYPDAYRIEKKHRVAVIRAMHNLASKRADLKIDGWRGQEFLLYRKAPEYQRKCLPLHPTSEASVSWVEIDREWTEWERLSKAFRSLSAANRKRFLDLVRDSADIIPWR